LNKKDHATSAMSNLSSKNIFKYHFRLPIYIQNKGKVRLQGGGPQSIKMFIK